MTGKMWRVVAFATALVLVPVAALAVAGSFTSSSASTPAVKGVNSSSASLAKGVYGSATGTSGTNYGVFGKSSSSSGYGVFSAGNLGIASGNALKCTRCINYADIGPLPAARVYNSVSQTIANTTQTNLSFNSETFDTMGLHSTSSLTSRLIAPVAGIYQVSSSVAWPSNGTGYRLLYLLKDGSPTMFETEAALAADTNFQHLSALVDLAAGQYIELRVYQNSGGPLSAVECGVAQACTWLAMHFVSPL